MKKFFLLLIVFMLFVPGSYAQTGPGEDDLEETGDDVPISGVEFLVLSAVAFGFYSVNKKQKELKSITA